MGARGRRRPHSERHTSTVRSSSTAASRDDRHPPADRELNYIPNAAARRWLKILLIALSWPVARLTPSCRRHTVLTTAMIDISAGSSSPLSWRRLRRHPLGLGDTQLTGIIREVTSAGPSPPTPPSSGSVVAMSVIEADPAESLLIRIDEGAGVRHHLTPAPSST